MRHRLAYDAGEPYIKYGIINEYEEVERHAIMGTEAYRGGGAPLLIR